MKRLYVLLFVACSLNMPLQAQVISSKNEVTIKDVVARLQSLSTSNIIEKAYLHFDKPYYNPGDTIYFKAYVTAGEQHQLSNISGVLHVDLVSKNDSVMQSLILQLKNGLAWGDFSLPNYLSKGNYKVRAYTQWMQNAGNAYVFNKTLAVNGKKIAQIFPVKAQDSKTDVQFFPEGGTFVTAVPCRIAFKAVGNNGLGAYVKGVVIDNNNKEVAKFVPAHLGMGQFYITPEAGKTYKAKITYTDGSINTVALPVAREKGMSLIVNNSDPDKIAIDINANKAYYLENKNEDISVVIYAAGIVKTVKTVLDNQVIGFDLPKKDFKSGIAQITLFSKSGVPLCERLVFIQNNDGADLLISSDKAVYANHNIATITLNAKAANKASIGNFSVAVVDESKTQVDEDQEGSILSDLLLTSELRGYVEQPGYYFLNVTADTRNNLDVLMLTQGYRRVQWNQILTQPQQPLAYKPEYGLTLSGKLMSKSGMPIPNEKLTLMASGTGQTITATTNEAGKYNFQDLEYADRSPFLITINNKALQNKAKIMVDNLAYHSPDVTAKTPNEKANESLPDFTSDVLTETNSKSKELKPVYIKGKVYKTSSLAGAGNADQVIFGKDLKSFSSLSQGLNGIARNINFSGGKVYLKSSMAFANGQTVSEPMMIVIDGAITTSSIDVIQPADVSSIEILRGANAAIYGLGSGAGVMVINTRQGDDVTEPSTEMAPGILSLSPKGFYIARQFYSPVYDVTKKYTADNHSTIYWKPNLVTDATGNATFEYFNGGPGQYRIIVEGIDNAGNIGSAVYKYKVQ